MTDKRNPPREFWINCYEGHSVFVAHRTEERSESDRSNPCDGCVHVIEFSAYEELKRQAQKMREALNEIANECPNMDVPTAYRYQALADFLREQAKQALEQFDEFMKEKT